MRNKGITLVALVVTIIIMLILAGVTLGTILGDNGLIGRTQKAVKTYQIASEREYLEQNVLSVQLDKYMGNVSSEKLGEILNTRNLENSSNWHIIKVNDKSYETGWNYIEKGTELEGYGKAKNNWLVNYETGEIIELEEDNYLSLSAGDMLAVKDSLIINIDSSIIDSNIQNSENELESQLGKDVDLVNFDYDENSGLTSTSFNFDGVNDYIKIKYDKEEQREALAQNGFTFEFYGIWDGGTSDYNEVSGHKGIFCYWNGDENKQARLRFGINKNWNCISWNAGFLREFSDFSQSKADPHNILYQINLEKLKKGAYITITLNTSKSYTVNNEKYQMGYEFNYEDITKERRIL